MTLRLAVALALLLALAASHWKAYTSGQKAAEAKSAKLTAIGNETARELERMNFKSKEAALETQKRKLVAKTVDARAAADAAVSLRDASERSLQAARKSVQACLISAKTHADVLNLCEGRYRDLAEKADGHVADVEALEQAWPK
jgi:hypothetical protein